MRPTEHFWRLWGPLLGSLPPSRGGGAVHFRVNRKFSKGRLAAEVWLGAAGSAAKGNRKCGSELPEVRRARPQRAELGKSPLWVWGPTRAPSHTRTGRRPRAPTAMFFTCGPNEAMVVSGEWGTNPPPTALGSGTGAPGLTPHRRLPPHPSRRVLPQPPRDGGGRTGVGGAVSAADPAVSGAGGREGMLGGEGGNGGL